ncbi:hypothetical protein M427DRAFT_42073 [Gonapodya prolifera JEL478]|uniref:F-box domain-containing protein n=1 Tax=Gonapodya prolifera (strain JEL478) TaxID=1344416 RepID=A0A139ARD1_GONPJ|nr:hypothetical protein M427DRAFT_42073 [Gonapodya prolifera JEL478]|eukprot:KXS19296.1 hypothetical protein M427DRAFT_42073 [Gonapodya prolifera JEL478]
MADDRESLSPTEGHTPVTDAMDVDGDERSVGDTRGHTMAAPGNTHGNSGENGAIDEAESSNNDGPESVLLSRDKGKSVVRDWSSPSSRERGFAADMPPEILQLILLRLSNGDLYSCLSVSKRWFTASASVLYEVVDAPLILSPQTPSRLAQPWSALVSLIGNSDQALRQTVQTSSTFPRCPYGKLVRFVNMSLTPPRFTAGGPFPRRPPPPIFPQPRILLDGKSGPALSVERPKKDPTTNTKQEDNAGEEAYVAHTKFLKVVGPSLAVLAAPGCLIEGRMFDSLLPTSAWSSLHSLDLSLARPVHSRGRSRPQPALLSLSALPDLAPNLRVLRLKGCRCIAATVVEVCESLRGTLEHLEIGSEGPGAVRRDPVPQTMQAQAQGQVLNAPTMPIPAAVLPVQPAAPAQPVAVPAGQPQPQQAPAAPIPQRRFAQMGASPLAGEHFTPRDLERIAFALGTTLRHLSLWGDHLLRTAGSLPRERFAGRFLKLVGLDLRAIELEVDDVMVGLVAGMLSSGPPEVVKVPGQTADPDDVPPPHPDARLDSLAIQGRLRSSDSLRVLSPYVYKVRSLRIETRLPSMTPPHRRAHVEGLRCLLASAPSLERLSLLSHDRFLGRDLRRMFDRVRGLKELEVPECTTLQLNVIFQVPGTGQMGVSVGMYRYPRADESFLHHLADTCGDTLRELRIALAGERDMGDRPPDEQEDDDEDGNGPNGGGNDFDGMGPGLGGAVAFGGDADLGGAIDQIVGDTMALLGGGGGGAMGGVGGGAMGNMFGVNAPNGINAPGTASANQEMLVDTDAPSAGGAVSSSFGGTSIEQASVAGASVLTPGIQTGDDFLNGLDSNIGAQIDLELISAGAPPSNADQTVARISADSAINQSEQAPDDPMTGVEGLESESGAKRKRDEEDNDESRKKARGTESGESSSSSAAPVEHSGAASGSFSSTFDATSQTPTTVEASAQLTPFVESIMQILGSPIFGGGPQAQNGGATIASGNSAEGVSSASSAGSSSSTGPGSTGTWLPLGIGPLLTAGSSNGISSSAPAALPSNGPPHSNGSGPSNVATESNDTPSAAPATGLSSSLVNWINTIGQAMFGHAIAGMGAMGGGSSAGGQGAGSANGSNGTGSPGAQGPQQGDFPLVLPLSAANFGTFFNNVTNQGGQVAALAGGQTAQVGGQTGSSNQQPTIGTANPNIFRSFHRSSVGDITVARIRRLPVMFRNLNRLALDVVEDEAVERMAGLYRSRPGEALVSGREVIIHSRRAVERLVDLE